MIKAFKRVDNEKIQYINMKDKISAGLEGLQNKITETNTKEEMNNTGICGDNKCFHICSPTGKKIRPNSDAPLLNSTKKKPWGMRIQN